jgi:dihydropteroate synthase
MLLRLPSITLDCTAPKLVGILNTTPDSFAAVGRTLDPGAALAHAQHMVSHGAAMIDLGAESTRPGASSVESREQIARLMPVLTRLQSDSVTRSTPISIDTTSSEVAQACLDAGVACINDVSGGTSDAAMLRTVARTRAGFIIMHRVLPPQHYRYSDRMSASLMRGSGVDEVLASLQSMCDAALQTGIASESIVLDPGLGFGKTVEQNLALIEATPKLRSLGHPIMSALSRKSFVGRIGLDRDSTPDERLPATLAFSMKHVAFGATLLRVHDVAEHAAMLRVLQALP